LDEVISVFFFSSFAEHHGRLPYPISPVFLSGYYGFVLWTGLNEYYDAWKS